MNGILVNFLKRTGVFMTGALIILLGYRHLFTVERPAWVGVCLVLGIAGVSAGILLFQRIRSRRRQHRRIEQEETLHANVEINNGRISIETLRSQWKAAIQFLKRSALKKRGNPIYALPWYMMIGPSGSGKTTALRSARLPSFADGNGAGHIVPTAHCDWSFFEPAIVIDTAGRYAVPADPEVDKEEWHTLLDLLARYRRRESLNGLTVAMSADQMMSDSLDSLESSGKMLRKYPIA